MYFIRSLSIDELHTGHPYSNIGLIALVYRFNISSIEAPAFLPEEIIYNL
jgi:hypothetical protein